MKVYVSQGYHPGANYICDGIADDVEIQAAIDYVEALGGGEVFLYSEHTFWIDKTINVPKCVSFQCWGTIVDNQSLSETAIKEVEE